MVRGLYVMNSRPFNQVYPLNIRNEIEKSVSIEEPPQTKESLTRNPSILQDVDVIFSGWGAPKLDQCFLESAPKLKAFFYAAGSVKKIVTDACWNRNLIISSAYAANAVPVAEYTLSQILFSLKQGWRYALTIKREGQFMNKHTAQVPGGYGSTVGIISLGRVGRRVCELLQNFDLNVIAYDPYVSEDEAAALHVELGSLDDVFRRADVVSLHAPWLKATEGMITGAHFNMMKPNATFMNTARGAVVREREMIDVLQRREDVTAILDVTYPEPPAHDSPLYTLSNVMLTPHIAGSLGDECGRMGAYMLEEFRRYMKGEPLQWPINRDNFAILA